MNESEETEEIKTFPLYPYLLQRQQALPNCKPISVGHPDDARYMTPNHPTISWNKMPALDLLFRVTSFVHMQDKTRLLQLITHL